MGEPLAPITATSHTSPASGRCTSATATGREPGRRPVDVGRQPGAGVEGHAGGGERRLGGRLRGRRRLEAGAVAVHVGQLVAVAGGHEQVHPLVEGVDLGVLLRTAPRRLHRRHGGRDEVEPQHDRRGRRGGRGAGRRARRPSRRRRRRERRRRRPAPGPASCLHHDGHDHRPPPRALADEAAHGAPHLLLEQLHVAGAGGEGRLHRLGHPASPSSSSSSASGA